MRARAGALGEPQLRAVEKSQDISHGDDHDYTVGSPHLRHDALRRRIDGRIAAAVRPELHWPVSTVVPLISNAFHGCYDQEFLTLSPFLN